jgi:multiple sugar transport system permease protein
VGSAVYAAFRPYSETQKYGIFSWPRSLTVQNFKDAWTQGNMTHTFLNTMFILIPSIILILFLSSTMAFAVSRYSWRFNVVLLLLFTAGNLLPPQVLFQPLFQMFKAMPWPDILSDTNTGSLLGTKVSVIIVHVAFQIGFCTFVLSNYMKTIPKELGEAALVDGASTSRQFFQIIMPLCRPVLAALATLEFTWLYNDFFWAVVLVNQGDQRPITSSIANLGGQFFSNDNLIAAASMIVALPTLAVYLALQKQFISGLTLGANKG